MDALPHNQHAVLFARVPHGLLILLPLAPASPWQEDSLRRLLLSRQYSAAAAAVGAVLRLAGLPPKPGA